MGKTIAVVFRANQIGNQVIGQRRAPAGDEVLEVCVELVPCRKDGRAVVGDVPLKNLFGVVGPVGEQLPVLGWCAQ